MKYYYRNKNDNSTLTLKHPLWRVELPMITDYDESGEIISVHEDTYTEEELALQNEYEMLDELPIPEPVVPDVNQIRIIELKQLLTSTDYQAIKYAEGLITVEDYEPIKAQRQAWRDEINELEK